MYYIILYYIILYHITTFHIISHHTISYHRRREQHLLLSITCVQGVPRLLCYISLIVRVLESHIE